jgi:hypothetical protein
MAGQERREVRLDADRPHARAAAAVRNAEGLVEIHVAHVGTDVARTREPYERDDDVADLTHDRRIHLVYGVTLSVIATMLPQLRLSANHAMWSAWHGAGLHHGTPGEVACITNLIQVALPRVDAVWRGALKAVGVQARLQGVVCHGHPRVRYPGASARCDLGDFLLVHDYQPDSGPLERRAVIVQAKVFHLAGVRAKNPIQLELYRRWPRFTTRAGLAVSPTLLLFMRAQALQDSFPF